MGASKRLRSLKSRDKHPISPPFVPCLGSVKAPSQVEIVSDLVVSLLQLNLALTLEVAKHCCNRRWRRIAHGTSGSSMWFQRACLEAMVYSISLQSSGSVSELAPKKR